MACRFGKEDIVSDEQTMVKNVVGSSIDTKNMKEFWEKKTGRQFPEKCRIYYCPNDAEVGGHMWVKGRNRRTFWYILPICQRCNTDPYLNDNYKDVNVKSVLVARRIQRGCPSPNR